jgi:tetratricopeptide (TPR) repeat protein
MRSQDPARAEAAGHAAVPHRPDVSGTRGGPGLRLQVLGPVLVTREGEPPTHSLVTQPRHLALLAYLLLQRPRGLHARDSLLPLLWPEHDTARARQALRNALHGLRTALGSDVIRSSGDQLIGVDPVRVRCDAIELEEPNAVSPSSNQHAGDAVEPFAGFHVLRAPLFDEWLNTERVRLTKLRASRAPGIVDADATVPSSGRGSLSPHDHGAYALYVRGNYMFLEAAHNGRVEDLERSRDCFERALAIDPEYGPAIAGLSNYFAVAGARGVIAPFHAAFARTIELSEQALRIDPSLAVPHTHFGVKALYLDDDVPRAVAAFTAAATLDPHYPEGRRFLGIALGLSGQTERGLAELRAAFQLEPRIPVYGNSLAAALMVKGELDAAEVLLRGVLESDPGYAMARERLLRLLEQQGRFQDAVNERRRTPAMPTAAQFLAAWEADGDAGYRRERTAELRQLVTTLEAKVMEGAAVSAADIFQPPVLRLAVACAELGEWTKARAWKLQACAARPGLALRFAAEPLLARLHARA